ncbi:MAG: molybdopterin-binding/glycosyltransferase family 2 protein [Polyangiaceae bacterium]
MRFGEVPTTSAEGAILAHTHRLAEGRAPLKKGRALTAEDCAALLASGVTHVTVARLDPGDLVEDEAARVVAEACAGPHIELARATTGRANAFAKERGVLVLSRDRVDAVNLVDEAITVATVPPYSVVEAGAMVFTVKVIPFAVPSAVVDRARTKALDPRPLAMIAPLRRKRAGLVMTTLPGVHDEPIAKAARAQAQRMAYLGGEVAREVRVPHDVPSVARAMEGLLADGMDLVLVLGAAAITDRGDVLPAAIRAIGGEVDHLGMPVDPGNLLLLGHRGAAPIVGVPGCARTLRQSGFDWVLERLVAEVPVTREDIMRMGAGGLLAEIPGRRAAEEPAPEAAPKRTPRVIAVVLAAGLSRRMGGPNKLLAEIDGVPMIARVVDAYLASKAAGVIVVLGHQAERVRAALEDRVRAASAGRDGRGEDRGERVRFVENPAYEEGLGASLRAGIEAVGEGYDGALVGLGDMPKVTAAHVDALIDAFDPAGPATIVVPVHDRKRGHPVVWSSRHFAEMRKLGGDVGARGLMERHADQVRAVPFDDAAVHLDVDTPEMLASAKTGTIEETGTVEQTGTIDKKDPLGDKG